jgi:hypothetical protein
MNEDAKMEISETLARLTPTLDVTEAGDVAGCFCGNCSDPIKVAMFSGHACRDSKGRPLAYNEHLVADGRCIICNRLWAAGGVHKCSGLKKLVVNFVGLPNVPGPGNDDERELFPKLGRLPGIHVSIFVLPSVRLESLEEGNPILAHAFLVASASVPSRGSSFFSLTGLDPDDTTPWERFKTAPRGTVFPTQASTGPYSLMARHDPQHGMAFDIPVGYLSKLTVALNLQIGAHTPQFMINW